MNRCIASSGVVPEESVSCKGIISRPITEGKSGTVSVDYAGGLAVTGKARQRSQLDYVTRSTDNWFPRHTVSAALRVARERTIIGDSIPAVGRVNISIIHRMQIAGDAHE